MQRWLARSIYIPTFAYNYLLGRVLHVRNWWDEVDGTIVLGARPLRRDVSTLRDLGVTGVVNMCEEFAGLPDSYEAAGMEQLWLPTVDFNHPSDEHVDSGADFIQKHVENGGKVYVHCKAGRARSATVALWWFVKYRGLTPEAAQQVLLGARPHINPLVFERPVIQRLHAALKQG